MGEEVKMTTPVPTKHSPELNGLEKQTMCFWLGSAWQDKPAPAPLPNDAQDTKIVEGQPLKVKLLRYLSFSIEFGVYGVVGCGWGRGQSRCLEKGL